MTDKQKIIALHGAGMNGAVWDALKAALSDFDFHAPYLPGHGGGADPLTSIQQMAETLSGVSGAVLIGHSMGALVAMAAAQRISASALILLGAAAAMPVNPDLLKTAVEDPAAAAGLVLKWGISSKNPDAAAIRARLAAQMAAVNPAAIGRDLAACDDFKDGENIARAFQSPVLVLSGSEDKMARPEEGRKLAALFPQGVFVEIPDCGHMPMVEKPGETALEIKRFLAR